jgi:deferrochelatase/peroxidase EfeB
MNAPTSIGPIDIQGNILKGHGRRYSCLVFFRFGPDPAKGKQLVHDAANQVGDLGITPAELQQKQANRLRALLAKATLIVPAELVAAKSEPFRSLALSAAGLKALEHSKETLEVRGQPASDQFWDGTERYGAEALGDREPWSEAFTPEPHGVFLVAHADKQTCLGLAQKCKNLVEGPDYGGKVSGIEEGFRWTPHGGDTAYEPFGFADGFARTQFTVKKTSRLRHLIEGTDLGDVRNTTRPFELPIDQVMIGDAGGFLGASFLVVRKIEQNVRAFYRAEAALKEKLELLPADVRRPKDAAALFIGRERNGAPLTYRGEGRPLAHFFHFGRDKTGSACPFHAHIRKMNPRQIFSRIGGHEMADRRNQKQAQFVRRGMVFGDEQALRPDWRHDPEGAPPGGCGLLFLGYMSAVGGQFLQMLQAWAGADDFPKIPAGADPLVVSAENWRWPQYEGVEVPTPDAFVTGRGVSYFVVLTLPVLRAL